MAEKAADKASAKAPVTSPGRARLVALLKRLGNGVLVASVALLLVISFHKTTLFEDLNQLTYDFVVDHAGLSKSSKDIVLVDLDEDTFQKQKVRRFPIPRPVYSDLIRRITVGKPKVIGLDVFLSEETNPAFDQEMEEALVGAKNVVLASQTPAGTVPGVMPLPRFCTPDASAGAVDPNYCAEKPAGAFAHAFVNMPYDPDGFVRQSQLFFKGANGVETSFPMLLAQIYSEKEFSPVKGKDYGMFMGRKVHYTDPNLMTYNIGSWGIEPATRIPAWKVLDGQIPPETFTGKLVLIGQTSDASGDTHLSPLFQMANKAGVRLKIGGTAIHAAGIRTLLEGTSINTMPTWLIYLCIFLAAAVAGGLILYLDLSVGITGLIVIMAAFIAVSMLLFAKLRIWLPFLPIEAGLVLTLPLTLFLRYTEERLISREAGAQRAQMMQLFSSYVDPAVAETIWERRSEMFLGGEEVVATVMFTDIRSFTALSSGQPPAVVLGWLNRYVAAMDEVIRDHGGFLNKFIGDGLMIIFGLPIGEGPAEDARSAVECAVAMLARVEKLNSDSTASEAAGGPSYPQIRIGCGIHTGSLMAGSIGSASRQEYSVIGETVNLSSRLESLNKPFKTEILMTAETANMVREFVPGIVSLGPSKVAGLQEEVEVFTVRPAVENAALGTPTSTTTQQPTLEGATT